MNKQELIERIEDFPCEASLVTEMIRINKNTLLGWVKQLDEPDKPVVPQFVAGWLNYCKRTGVDLYHAFEIGDLYLGNYAYQKDYSKLKGYFETEENQELFARAWLDGYTVEEEKRYLVKIKGVACPYLNYDTINELWFYNQKIEGTYTKTKHTRKELEEAGFGEVFNSSLFEVEEVEE